MSGEYLPRVVDTELDELLPALPALSLEAQRASARRRQPGAGHEPSTRSTRPARWSSSRRTCGVGHLRTHGGEHEIDLIVERGHHCVLVVEVKLAHTVRDEDLRHLRWLEDQLGDRVLDAIVITMGADAYRRPDGIGVVPAALLGP